MHSRGICHRDIKLENIMYSSPSPSSPIKLIDFGLSAKYCSKTPSSKMTKSCGTIYTASPEVLTGKSYTTQTDIWSCGVVAYVMLSKGEVPFLKETEDLMVEEKVRQLREGKVPFGHPVWKSVSRRGKEFVLACLRKHPGSRWTAKEALDFLQTKWKPSLTSGGDPANNTANAASLHSSSSSRPPPSPIRPLTSSSSAESSSQQPPLPPHSSTSTSTAGSINDDGNKQQRRGKKYRRRINSTMLRSFQDFSNAGLLKRKALVTMAHTMDKNELEEMSEHFKAIDVNNDGTITYAEMRSALKEQREIDDEKVDEIFKGIDFDGSGVIHYKEFIAAACESCGLVTQDRVMEAFDRMDSDNSGAISRDNLKGLLGTDYDEQTATEMMLGKGEEGVDYEMFENVVFGRADSMDKEDKTSNRKSDSSEHNGSNG